MRKYCCVKKCKNSNYKITSAKKNEIKFYSFPSDNPLMPWLQQKRLKWIDALKKHAKHSDDWKPAKYAFICSAHFVGNAKSEHPTHPSYLPTLFGSNVDHQKSMQKLERWKRQKLREAKLKESESKISSTKTGTEDSDEEKTKSIGCQTDEGLDESCDDSIMYDSIFFSKGGQVDEDDAYIILCSK